MKTTTRVISLTITTAALWSPWACVAADSDYQFPVPAREVILKDLRPQHPRLLLNGEEWNELRLRTDREPKLREWRQKVREEAVRLLGQAPSKYEIPDGKRLLATSRRVLDRVYTLGLMYRLDADKRFADRAWLELDTAAQFKDWNPKHFLDTAEMTHAFAIGYDWLYDCWTAEQRDTLRRAIIEMGLNQGRGNYKERLTGFARVHHNWNQVCNGGLGMGALAIADTDAELATEILHGVLRSLPLAMNEFGPDGAWNEGPGYWNYATAYNVVILAGMESALGTDFGLSRIPGFEQTGYFPLYITSPIEKTFNYADGGEGGFRAPQLFWLSRRFNQPVLAWRQTEKAEPSALDVVWFTSRATPPKTAALNLDRYFRSVEVATFRSDWEDPNALFAGFKAGDNRANHGHLDLGSFVFDAAGVRWASDLGSDNYNLPEFFGAKRWTYYRNRAEGQNVLVLNPSAEPGQDPTAYARITKFKSLPQLSYAVADLTPAYAAQNARVVRGVMLINKEQLLVQDEIEAATGAAAYWFMHTQAGVTVSDSGKEALLESGGKTLKARLLDPPAGKLIVMDAKPMPNSPDPAGQKKNTGYRKLTVQVPKSERMRIAVLLTPKLGPVEPAVPALKLLAEW